MPKYVFAICFFLLTTSLSAQRNNLDVQQEYLRAKAMFQQQNWTGAMPAFRQVAASSEAGTLTEYASFYYGLSALYAGRPTEAKAMFLQILEKYPDWNKRDEVRFWLSRTYAGESNWSAAIGQIKQIRNRAVETDAWSALSSELSRKASLTELKILNQQHPDNRYLAEALAQSITRQPRANQDQELLAYLIKRHNLDQDLLRKPKIAATEYKQAYNVAVMLPFMANKLQPERNIRDLYFPLDIYEGMRIAQQELESEGINITLTAYDTERDSLRTLQLLRSTEIKNADLMVGPLFPGPAAAAGEWALQNQINVINPLSVNPDNVKNNPYVFLYKPSLITQAHKAAEFAARTFPSRRALVLYGAKDRDSIMAQAYYNRLRERGFDQIRLLRVERGEEPDVRDLLVSSNRSDMESGGRLSVDSLGHLFVASDDRLLVSSTLSALGGRSKKLPLIGLGSWISSSSTGESLVSYTQAERLGAYLVAPEYIDYAKPSFFSFREKYLEQVHAMPSQYAYLGYDLMMYFGQMLHKHGTLFQNGLVNEPFSKGALCAGFDYAGRQDNQCVPIVQFNNSALEIIYQ